jgi:hypothetical protein
VRLFVVAVFSLLASNAFAQTLTFEEVGKIPGQAERIRVQGKYVFTSVNKTLTAFDVSNPASPKRLGEYSFADRILGFRTSGTRVYVAADLSGLGILEVSDAGLKLRGLFKTPGSAKNVAVSGNTVVVADQVGGLDIIDVSNSAKPVLKSSVYLDGFASDVVIADSLAYAVDRPNGFYVVDLKKPNVEDPLSTLRSSLSVNGGLQVEIMPGLAIRALGALLLYDVSNPAKPVELMPFRVPGNLQRVSLRGTLAYAASGPEGLQVVDLSMPSMPRIVGSYKIANPAVDVAVADSLVFMAVRGADVVILRKR